MVDSKELLIGIGDLHGHYPALKILLESLDRQYHIFADGRLRENIELVFTGDYIDRGNSNLKVINRLIELSHDKSCIQLFGNHELMALADLDAARGMSSPSEYKYGSLHGMNGGDKFISEFSDISYYIREMSSDGKIGSWMRKLKPFYVSSSFGVKILFVHGGIPDQISDSGDLESYLAFFNKRMAASTIVMGGSKQKYSTERLDGESIFWDRRMITKSKNEIAELLSRLNVDKIVVGHTPHPKITNYFNLVFDIDTGMTPAYGSNTPAAIVFKKDGIYEFCAGSEKRLDN